MSCPDCNSLAYAHELLSCADCFLSGRHDLEWEILRANGLIRVLEVELARGRTA